MKSFRTMVEAQSTDVRGLFDDGEYKVVVYKNPTRKTLGQITNAALGSDSHPGVHLRAITAQHKGTKQVHRYVWGGTAHDNSEDLLQQLRQRGDITPEHAVYKHCYQAERPIKTDRRNNVDLWGSDLHETDIPHTEQTLAKKAVHLATK